MNINFECKERKSKMASKKTVFEKKPCLKVKFEVYLHKFQYGDVTNASLGVGNLGTGGVSGCNRLRYDQHLTSELEGDKMVLKISKPPRNKDSFSSLTGQTISWLLKVIAKQSNEIFFHK